MKTIKFSRCPIGKHRGERWPKLSRIDVGKPVTLIGVDLLYSIVSKEFIESDTFTDFTIDDWNELLTTFYGFRPVLLKLIYQQGNTTITTARAYEWRKHKYYLDCIGKEFMVVET